MMTRYQAWCATPARRWPHGVGRRLGAVGAAGLGEDVADMRRHGIEADRQHHRDVGVAAADGDAGPAPRPRVMSVRRLAADAGCGPGRRPAARWSAPPARACQAARALSRQSRNNAVACSRSPGSVACQQHGGIVIPRMRERRMSADAGVHCQRRLEVTLRLGPARHGGAKQSEISIRRTEADKMPHNGCGRHKAASVDTTRLL